MDKQTIKVLKRGLDIAVNGELYTLKTIASISHSDHFSIRQKMLFITEHTHQVTKRSRITTVIIIQMIGFIATVANHTLICIQ
jgi:hypothetical protein